MVPHGAEKRRGEERRGEERRGRGSSSGALIRTEGIKNGGKEGGGCVVFAKVARVDDFQLLAMLE